MIQDNACLCTPLRQTAFAATEFFDRVLEPSGLKITMFRVLRRAAEADKPTITALADIVGLDRSLLGRNLRVLERDGLVRFANDPRDERSKLVLLTPDGDAALKKALPLWEKAQAQMKSALGDEKNPVFHTLAKVNLVAEAAI